MTDMSQQVHDEMPSSDDVHVACGRTIAFVLALGEKSQANVLSVLEAARSARFPAVFILSSPQRSEESLEAVRLLGRSGKIIVQAVEYDSYAAIGMTRNAGNFELFGMSYGLLATMRAVAESVLDEYDSVLVIDGDQEKVTADHLIALCRDARQRTGIDAMGSWIEWLRRSPYFISRDFLESIDEAPFAKPAIDGAKPLPHLNTADHLFDEELSASAKPLTNVEAFFRECTMSALQAVKLAQYARKHPGAELHSPNQKPSLTAASNPEPLNTADRELLKIAIRVLQEAEAASGDEANELQWADAFGARNRRDFPLLNDRDHKDRLAYLDSAATSQRLGQALQAQSDFDKHENANVYRGAYELSAQATFTLNGARQRLEQFIGAQWREVVFTANATAALNLVAQAWGEANIEKGDRIICTLSAHHSNSLPFALLAQRKGAEIDYVGYDENGRIDKASYDAALAKGAKLVCLEHVGNVFGIELPIEELAKKAHVVGARVLVDAAQALAHVKVDVRELGADWIAFSAHKAYGPMGIGALWISPAAFEEMEPLAGGGGTVSYLSTDSHVFRPLALRFEPGTPAVSQAVGWATAIEYLENLGTEAIARHDAALTRYLVRGLERIDGVNVIGDHSSEDGQNGLVAFTLRSVAPGDLASFLGRLEVAIRAGGHCALPLHAALGVIGTNRISIAAYTTRDDVDAALVGIELCRRLYESR